MLRLNVAGSGLHGLEFQPPLQCRPAGQPSESGPSVVSCRFSSSRMGAVSVLSSEGSWPDHLEDPCREPSTLPGDGWESLVSVVALLSTNGHLCPFFFFSLAIEFVGVSAG